MTYQNINNIDLKKIEFFCDRNLQPNIIDTNIDKCG